MKYKNTLNGIVIDVASEVKGDNWEVLEPSGTPDSKTSQKRNQKRKADGNE